MMGSLWVMVMVAQTALGYLGADQVGRAITYVGNEIDSSYDALGGTWSSFVDSGYVDTFIAIAQVTYNGNYGMQLETRHYPADTTLSPSFDTVTAYEVGSEVWVSMDLFGTGTPSDLRYFLTPLSVGQNWVQNAPNPVIMDADGDGDLDTMYLNNDTATVLAQEAVSVPAGSFTAYHVVRYIDYSVIFTNPGLFEPESARSYMEFHQWVAPQWGIVRDSIYSWTDAYVFGSAVPVSRSYDTREATDRFVPVEENPIARQNQELHLRYTAHELYLSGDISAPVAVRLVDATGRVVRSREGLNLRSGGSLSLGGLHQGVYFLRVEAGRTTWIRPVIVGGTQ